jgi:diphthine-ammonia ligase
MQTKTSTPLNVIALISGGKDSFFSLLHCQALGHNVLALANLQPPATVNSDYNQDNEVDLNSHMYQTAGYALIPLYDRALSIPLYTGTITGTAVNLAKEYSSTDTTSASNDDSQGREQEEGDETESLLPLLKRIKKAHPTANAVCSGAILSTYQRTRVESICLRLGLIPLAFLWQYPILPFLGQAPGGLLRDVADAGFDARIVKVASGGLDEGFLWESLAHARLRSRVESAVSRFGGSVLGEGGEFETFVVNGPGSIFKGRLVVESEDIEVKRGEGGEAWLNFKDAKVVMKDEGERTVKALLPQPPALLDTEFEALLDQAVVPIVIHEGSLSTMAPISWAAPSSTTVHYPLSQTLIVSNLTSQINAVSSGISEQMHSIATQLTTILAKYSLSANNLIFTTILLRSISDFISINAIYGTLFKMPNPPARVTIACGSSMPTGKDILLSAIAHTGPNSERRGLHVQSRSYWAPANIGPYSQAISIDANTDIQTSRDSKGLSITFIAGQIPLVPFNMEQTVPEPGENAGKVFRSRVILSLQHLTRVGQQMGCDFWSGAIAFITGDRNSGLTSDPKIEANSAPTLGVFQKANVAYSIWQTLHKNAYTMYKGAELIDDEGNEDDENGPDVWDLKYGTMKNHGYAVDQVEDQIKSLPSYANVIPTLRDHGSGRDSIPVPPFIAAQVDALPRESDIEWQAGGYSGGKVDIRSRLDENLPDQYEMKLASQLVGASTHQTAIPETWGATIIELLSSTGLETSSDTDPRVSFDISSQITEDKKHDQNTNTGHSKEQKPSSIKTAFLSIPLSEITHSKDNIQEKLLNLINSISSNSTRPIATTVYTPRPDLFSCTHDHESNCSHKCGLNSNTGSNSGTETSRSEDNPQVIVIPCFRVWGCLPFSFPSSSSSSSHILSSTAPTAPNLPFPPGKKSELNPNLNTHIKHTTTSSSSALAEEQKETRKCIFQEIGAGVVLRW